MSKTKCYGVCPQQNHHICMHCKYLEDCCIEYQEYIDREATYEHIRDSIT